MKSGREACGGDHHFTQPVNINVRVEGKTEDVLLKPINQGKCHREGESRDLADMAQSSFWKAVHRQWKVLLGGDT